MREDAGVMTIKYFAYGSNMDEEVMQACCPTHRFIGAARLDDHRLAFTRRSVRTGTGVADAVFDRGQTVWGALYELDPEDLRKLDRKEGSGWAYEQQRCRVHLFADGSEQDSITYTVLQKEREEIPPSRAYLKRLITAARRRGLPEQYIASLTRRWAAI
jgi:gamma-glutamylcyclotransferase